MLKEKTLHYSNVCTAVALNNFTKTIIKIIIRIIWDYGLWEETLVKGREKRSSWNKYWHPSWNVMASWGLLFLWVGMAGIGGTGGGVSRTAGQELWMDITEILWLSFIVM